MALLSKSDIFERVVRAIRECGWQFLYLSSATEHPLRLRVFDESESHTVRIYVWNVTHGGGSARPKDEFRIQITGLPTRRFEPEPDGKTLILGWWEEAGVFAGFDFRRHSGVLGFSPSLQIREHYLWDAQTKGFSPCDKGNHEIAIAFHPTFLVEYIRDLEAIHDLGRSPSEFQVLSNVASNPNAVNDAEIQTVAEQRRTVVVSVRRTLRKNSFQRRVLKAYNQSCAMCGIQLELIEAAHIVPVLHEKSTDETSNGVALCYLHHKAYDYALVAIADDYHVLTSRREAQRLHELHRDAGIDDFRKAIRPKILVPSNISDRPHVDCIRIARDVRGWVE